MKTKRGYTLMEVVVSLGILFLLGMLTVAVLSPARAKSKETVCISNMHQIGQALRMYMDDYDGQSVIQGVASSPYQLGLPSRDAYLTFKNKYVNSKQVWYCPAYHNKKPVSELASTYEVHLFPGTTRAEKQKQWLAKRGDLFPLLVCHDHYPGDIDKVKQEMSSWEKRRVIVLRLNLQVESLLFSSSMQSYNY